MISIQKLAFVPVFLLAITSHAQIQSVSPEQKDWINRSNKFTQSLIDIDEKYSPEFGSEQGLANYDTLISVPTLQNMIAERKDKTSLLAQLKESKVKETILPLVQDLNILIDQTELAFREEDFSLSNEVPYLNPTSSVFEGIQYLLDDQTPEARRTSAVIRLKKYAGLQSGYEPLTKIMQDRTTSQMNKPGMIYPSRQEMEISLSRNASMLSGIKDLFIKYKISGWEQPYESIKRQLEDYDQWITTTLIPKGRTDFRLPPEEYKLALEGYGINIPPAEMAKIAHAAFQDIVSQMKPLAAQVAKKHHLAYSDYQSVVKYLKKEQILGDSIMIVYKKHLSDIEEIIRKYHLVTLPNRAAIIRLATAAETAQQPAPHMVPPPFLNNTGQRGVFVLPLNNPTKPGEKEDKYDDFTFDAASWTIIAHEVRPGHELQFDKMVEEGVSNARALYAFNSTNVEGWALYSESITLPYMPVEGQLISLDYRLLRAARAFLDPELQAGTITQDQAMDVLMNQVICSHAMAKQEVERYTVRAPGQANSYFYGFTKINQIRKDTEKELGTKFNQQSFHDFILSQGILPPALIKDAVEREYVPSAKK